MNKTLSDYRENYSMGELDEADVPADPMVFFEQWLTTARECEPIIEPTAMSIATVNADGQPSSRMVLLKALDHGFVFYTNYNSQKGQDLAANPKAALLFHWPPLERQIRIQGHVEKVADNLSDDYFQSRPRASQLGAAASAQSSVVQAGEVAQHFAQLDKQYDKQTIPRPHSWGGYRLIPDNIEFWQGRRSRLHDRIHYQLNDKGWFIQRLAP